MSSSSAPATTTGGSTRDAPSSARCSSPAATSRSAPIGAARPYKGKLKVGPDDSAGHPQVAYSLPLGGLRKGDQLVVEGKAVTGIGALPYNITQRTSLIFTNRPGSVKPNGKIIETNPRLSADNGYGCTHGPSAHRNPCTVGKYGVVSVKKSSKKPWYINFVVSQEASDVGPKASKWRSERPRLDLRRRLSDRPQVPRRLGLLRLFDRRRQLVHLRAPESSPAARSSSASSTASAASASTQGRYSCQRRSSGPSKLICKWHSDGSFGDSRRYVCDSKAFLSKKNNWNIKVCKDALGAQLWHLLQVQQGISPDVRRRLQGDREARLTGASGSRRASAPPATTSAAASRATAPSPTAGTSTPAGTRSTTRAEALRRDESMISPL